MLIALSEYAKIYNRSDCTLRRLAENGTLKTAHKVNGKWVVDSAEAYPVKRQRQKNNSKITVASLFSGCGGMDLGIVGGFDFLGKHYGKTGLEIVWANDINPSACITYRKNFGDYIIEGDISDKIDSLPSSVDIVAGGFPCQDISINGKMLGVNGKRSSLYTYIVEAVKRTNPKVFIAENVGGLLLKQNDYSLNKILGDFNSLGYNLHYKLYHAEEYGVPQTRERVIFVGVKKGLPKFTPPQTLTSKPVSAYEALHDLESMPANKEFAHIWSNAKVSGEQGNRKLVADRPGYTMRAECHGNIQFHYSLPRRISMREAARIQSFPDTFVFPCGLRETERQIGNAVPPVLAWHIANAVKRVIEKDGQLNDNERI
ncbi:MAG: DNA cytosine methyltransferase [Clostridia bacterium]|nr:DNA cytosine methyltransferase [Clostridia bacterium]